jgi:hypothetical protein
VTHAFEPVIPRCRVGWLPVGFQLDVTEKGDEIAASTARVGTPAARKATAVDSTRYRRVALSPPFVISVPLRTTTQTCVPSGKSWKYLAWIHRAG